MNKQSTYLLDNPSDALKPGEMPKLLFMAGLASTITYALTKISLGNIAKISSIIFIVLGVWASLYYTKKRFLRFAYQLLVLSIIVQILSWLFSKATHPELALDAPDIEYLSRLFIIIPIAWWLAGKTRNVLLLWLAASIGIVTAPWLRGDGVEEILLGLQGTRVDFNISNAQHPSLFFGTLLLGLLTLHKRFWSSKKYFYIPVIAWVALVIFSLIIVVITQTRSNWLALAVTAAFAVIAIFIKAIKQRAHKLFFSFLIIFAVLVASLHLTFRDILSNRVSAESEVVELLLNGNIEEIPYTSIGIRIHSWRAGLEAFLEKPLLGWGPNGKTLAIQESSKIPQYIKDDYGHLHNTYLEILVNFGIIGFAIFSIFIGWVVKSLIMAKKTKKMPEDIFLFSILALIFWSITNIFESYLMFWTGVFLFNIVLGGALTYIHSESKEKAAAYHHG